YSITASMSLRLISLSPFFTINASGDFLERNCIYYPSFELDRFQSRIACNKLTKFYDESLTRFRYALNPSIKVDRRRFRDNMQGVDHVGIDVGRLEFSCRLRES